MDSVPRKGYSLTLHFNHLVKINKPKIYFDVGQAAPSYRGGGSYMKNARKKAKRKNNKMQTIYQINQEYLYIW